MFAPSVARLALAALLAAGATGGQPVKVKVALPSRASLTRTRAGIELRWASADLHPVEVEARPGAVLGVRIRTALTGSAATPETFGTEQLTSPPSFNPGDMSLLTAPAGVVATHLHIRIEVFETDLPTQHHWMPESGNFRVLHTVAFSQPVPQ